MGSFVVIILTTILWHSTPKGDPEVSFLVTKSYKECKTLRKAYLTEMKYEVGEKSPTSPVFDAWCDIRLSNPNIHKPI